MLLMNMNFSVEKHEIYQSRGIEIISDILEKYIIQYPLNQDNEL